MRLRPYILSPLLLALFVSCFPSFAGAQSGPVILSLLAPAEIQPLGGAFDVEVMVTGATNLGAFQFDLAYDKSRLIVTGMTLGSLLGQVSDCDYHTARCARALGLVDIPEGVKVGAVSYGSGPGFSGDGLLAVLHLKSLGKPGIGSLQMQNALATDTAANSTLPNTQGTTVIIGPAKVYLPLILSEPALTFPDLVPLELKVEPSSGLDTDTAVNLSVVLTNVGTATARRSFWVDLYVNPARPPEQAGDIWSKVCKTSPEDACLNALGLAWQITQDVPPGQTVTLTSRPDDLYLVGAQTRWPGRFTTAGEIQLWTYVDSWNGESAAGGFVLESDETNNRLGPVIVRVTNRGEALETRDGDQATNEPILPRPVPYP